jgi:hypothetical protein
MLRNLFDDLRIRYAMWRYGITKDNRLNHLTHDERTAINAMQTLKDLHPGVDVQAWFRKAIHTEAFTTPDALLQIIHQVHASGRFTTDHINQIASHGIALDFGGNYDKIKNAAKIGRLQNAVRQLAFIAGPGFTTDHLVDEGIVKQGDL